MRRAVICGVAGVAAFWIVYSICYGFVFWITGDIHNGWAVLACLLVGVISGIIATLKVRVLLKRLTEQARG